MSPAQAAALARLRAGAGPVVAATARVLSEQYGYIEPAGVHTGTWRLTARGQTHLAASDRAAAFEAQRAALTEGAVAWAKRVEAWMVAHDLYNDLNFTWWRAMRHVAACRHDGVEPLWDGPWATAAQQWVQDHVAVAARVLSDYEAARETARLRAVGVVVDYEPEARRPIARHEAVAASDLGDNVIGLATYREHRP